MENIFSIDNFNIIEDEENYYFFRSLEPGDLKDLENETIKENDEYTRLRTDRERWEEEHPEEKPRWNSESKVSLEEMYSHIKMHYSLQTNCISLTSNANVARTYGEAFSDKYVMIRVPKREMGERVFQAGQYMLQEIEKIVEQEIERQDLTEEIEQDLKAIDEAKTSDEIKDVIKTRYKSKEGMDASKAGLKKGITYKSPHARISSYQALNEKQTLIKNKIIAKLTVLERKQVMKPLMTRASNNNLLIQTVGSAFSSSEQIYYGDIDGDRITDISKEILDIFGLLQQAEGQDEKIVSELKREVIKFVNEKGQLNIPEDSQLKKEYNLKNDITVEEMYELTNGKVEFGIANSIVKNMFYLAKGQQEARELSEFLRNITNNNPRYENLIEYIENNGFEIEPKICTRQSNRGYRLSESVNLQLNQNELSLVSQIRNLTDSEQIEILEKGGLSDTKGIITNTFSNIQRDEKISREEYYAGAIIDSYNWADIGVEEFTIEQRNDFLKKLQEKDCVTIYNKLKEAGISDKDIPLYAINLASREQLNNILQEENYIELIHQNKENLSQKLSIPQVETFLGYYDIEGTDIVLRDYQRNAVEKTDKIFENKRFASVVLPTGAGKTFVALTELLEHKDEPMLYLAPQNEILEQTKDRIIEYIHGKKGTIGKTKEKIIAEVFPNIKFETYSGLLAQRGKNTIKDNYGFIVLDELHRTGAKEWESKLDKLLDNQDENTKVLGITATPTRDMDDRNMANEMALKLGYTKEEVQKRNHIAMDMDLVDAIKLGLVVNPKLVSCEYILKEDGSMENLLEKINSIEDEKEREEKLAKYEKLRRNLDDAEGIPEILRKNIKQGGKYIVFIPATDSGEIEDEDGNKLGKKTGKDKVKEYEQKMIEYLKDSGISLKCYSMLGAYSDNVNEAQLKSFENDNSEDANFMIVMNKANEGLHVKGIDGIVWLRALDENSKILYLQQLGRAIYSEDPNNPTSDEKRPVIIDLVNNTLKVNIDKDIKNNTRRDDLELLSLVVDWAQLHNGLPNIDSTNRVEQRYAATLYRIQNKYMQYVNGFEQFTGLDEEKQEQIEAILEKGAEIDLWDIELPTKTIEKVNKIIEVDTFELNGVLKDYVELENEIDGELGKGAVEIFIEKLEKLQEIGVDVSKIEVKDTIETLMKKQKIEIDEKEIERIGLRLDDKIGISKNSITSAYRGKGKSTPPTKEQVEKLLEFGISLEERNVTDEFIEKLERLQKISVDVSKIQVKDTIETLMKKQKIEIDEKEIERIGLRLDDKIGQSKSNISQAYRGKGTCTPPTKEQVEKLLEFGISLEERNVTDEFIEKLERLQKISVDVSKIVDTDTIETLMKKQKIEIDEKEIERIGLRLDDKIGQSKHNIYRAYRGKGKYTPPTKEQVEKLLEFGISLEKRNVTDEFIEKLERLQKISVDVSKIEVKDTIETLIKKQKIEIDEKEIERIGLELDDKIGQSKRSITSAYRGKGTCTPPTEEQVKRLLELGIILEKIERNVTDEFIEKMEKLQGIGVDTSDIKHRDTIEELAKRSGISKEGIEKIGLNPNDKIGPSKNNISQAYRGKGASTQPTEEQVKRLLELGISLEKKKRTGKEIVEASISSLKDIDMADAEDIALKQLVEQTKEGGINIDEQS